AFLALAATMALITLFETAARENVPNSLGLSAALLFVAFIAYPWIAQRSQAFRRRVPRLALYRTLQVGVWIASLAPLLPMLSAMTAGDSMDDKRIGGWALAALAGGALRPLGLQTLRRLYEGNKGAPADWLASALADLREATNGRSLDEALRRLGRESLRARDAQLWIVAGEPALGAQTLSSLSRLPEIFDLRDGAYNREEADPFAIEERLTDEDRSRLEDGDVALLTPARTAEGRTVALIAFSTKTTETPFRRDEVAAVNLLSSAVGLQLERFGRQQLQRTDEDAGDPGSLCIECGQIQAVDVYECCDLPTVETDVPRRLGERFLLEQQLGNGSFGTVYAARDLELHRAVAIKALDGSHSNGEALAREATAAARLSHPHVAAAYSLERQGGRKFLVTELLEGGTLKDRLDEGPLDARTTVALGLQIAEALRAAHDLGFTHGDVKPSNIGFTAGGTAKLIDLGLVSLVSEAKGSASPSGSELASTRALPGGGKGTPIYASPETFAGNPAGSTDDLWSLNVVLWESLTGFNPFALGNLEKVSQAVLGGCQRDPRSAGAECSDALARLLLKGLAAHIGHRHVDAEDLLSDLRQAL
ncbi:MAG: serine/threonine-protein kinase, partial [Acidobacteriota bacterium]